MITQKYYNSKTWRLRKIDSCRDKEPIFRFKKLKSGKEFPCCDYHGTCINKAYAEVFPGALKKGKGWCYLCKKHYYAEEKRLKYKLPACLNVEW